MYCARCGVELQKGVARCPLCSLPVWHPDLQEEKEPAPYPRYTEPETVSHSAVLFLLSFLFLLPALICLQVDLKLDGAVTWSGYVCLSGSAGEIPPSFSPFLWPCPWVLPSISL